ncbi:MAG TPA: DHH family phosphoesterase [Halobacteria archaeon]|nr:DHH family phosphoesterase [Halobacteria archaeon]
MENLVRDLDNAVEFIKDAERIHVFSHNDTDGISAAGILCNAFLRMNKRYQVTIIKSFDKIVLKDVSDDELVVFCDMGSNNIEEISSTGLKTIILDHHMPGGKDGYDDIVHINPHLYGIDGSKELSASGVCYFLAKKMGKNEDLSYLAVVGAIGDKQDLKKANEIIVNEALRSNMIETKRCIKLSGEDILTGLTYSIDPYFDFSGDEKDVKSFLDRLNLKHDTKIYNLSEEEIDRLSKSLIKKLPDNLPDEVKNCIVGDTFFIKEGPVKNLLFLVDILNSCGKMDKSGLALSLCLKGKYKSKNGKVISYQDSEEFLSILKEAERYTLDFKISVIEEVKNARTKLKKKKNLQYVNIDKKGITGEVASTIIRYVSPNLPIFAINTANGENGNGEVKISARGTNYLIRRGLDLAKVTNIAAKKVGGRGGGHNIASGASIPSDKVDLFLNTADEIIGRQIVR